MKICCADKLEKLPPYIFSRINKLKLEAYAKNLDVIDLVMGNPDIPVSKKIIDRLCDTVINHPKTHRYPQAKGMPKFRKTVADWFYRRFGVKLDPETEVLALVGSKEGVGHLCMAILNPNDLAIIPDPGYPVYYNGVILANGRVYQMPILEQNEYLPELEKIPTKILREAKIMFLNYPNNPTGAVIKDISFFKEVIKFAKKYNIIIVHDNAYSELTFDGYTAPSFLEIEGAKDVGVEFHSFSKTYSMAGWRIGFVVGNRDIIRYLEKFKSFIDYGVATFIQLAAVVALTESDDYVKEMRKIYQERRDKFIKELNKIGWQIEKPLGTMYLWAKLPEKFRKVGSLEFCVSLLNETGVAISPGSGFGKYGEGYVRMALVTHINRFHDAALRFKKFFQKTIDA
jgi:LL-diaminopimelate aminotransferase